MIINHEHPESVKLRSKLGNDAFNGALYYSQEITKFFIPTIKTDRGWNTIRAGKVCEDHSIVFVHDIFHGVQRYEYTLPYKDIVYVVSTPWNVKEFEPYGKVIYLPLSVDTEYVKQFEREKDREICFVGRREWIRGADVIKLPDGIDYLSNIPRELLLSKLGRFRKVYATCRCAIEAKVLGCDILPYHPAFPDPSIWEVFDSRDAAKILQEKLNEIDG